MEYRSTMQKRSPKRIPTRLLNQVQKMGLLHLTQKSNPNHEPAGSSTGGQFASAQGTLGMGGDVAADTRKFHELKAHLAQINNSLLPYMDHPDAKAVQEKMDEMRSVVHKISKLNVDQGGLEGIGQPGGPKDIVVIGGGPGGLSSAIMGVADGLDVMVIEAHTSTGGQAKFSSRIENYPGYPIGVSGTKLAGDMYEQATRLGADIKTGTRVTGLSYDEKTGLKTITMDDGHTVQSRSVVLAGGVEFNKTHFPGSESKDVIYGDGQMIQKQYGGKPVIVLGGSNGAAQAALGAAQTAQQVYLVSRSPLEKSMSDYQIQAVNNHPKIQVIAGDSIHHADLDAQGRVQGVTTDKGKSLPASAIGVFLGASPQTDWLPSQIKREGGKIKTNSNLETDLPGVFAIGDARAGSIGRVGAAVGDGQMAEKNVFNYFATLKSKSHAPTVSKSDHAGYVDQMIDDLFDLDREYPLPLSQYVEQDIVQKINLNHEPSGSPKGGQFSAGSRQRESNAKQATAYAEKISSMAYNKSTHLEAVQAHEHAAQVHRDSARQSATPQLYQAHAKYHTAMAASHREFLLAKKINLNHEPGGSPKGGQFASASGGAPTKPLLQGQSTEEAWSKDGVYTPARQAWHEKVADAFIKGKTSPEGSPELTVMGGGTAVGKSTLSNKIMDANPNTVHVDADEFKLLIPEYAELKKSDPMHAPGLVHEESSAIAKLITAKAIARNLNVLYDSSSAGTGSAKLLTAMTAHSNYHIHALFADVPMDVARARAKARAENPNNKGGFGRIIHEDLMQSSHAMAAANFMKIKDLPHVANVELFDTSTSNAPSLIYRRLGKNNGVVFDLPKWEAYKAKATSAAGLIRPQGANYPMDKKAAADTPLKEGQFRGIDNDINWKEGEFEKLVAEEMARLEKDKKKD